MGTQLSLEKNKNRLLLFILLLALFVRLWVFPVVFSNGNITLLGADTYYHARRILVTVFHFPDVLAFDSYLDFPYGATIGWPPLYDQFIALLALIIGFGKPSFYTIEAITAIVPPVFGVLTVLLVFLISEKLFDLRVGLISAGIFAITPAHAYISFLGYADHHVAETLLSTAAYLFFIIALKRLQKNNISFGNFRGSILRNSLFPALTGITLALSIFTWDGAPIFVGLIGMYIPIQFVIDRKLQRNSDSLVITGGVAFLVSLLIITPVALSHGRGFEINSYLPTLFHVGFLSVFFFLCMLLGAMQRMQFKKWWYHPLLLMLIFIAAVSFLKIFSPQFYQSTANGIRYLFGGGILATIEEAVPLFNTAAGAFTLDNVWRAYTLSFFVALISFIYFIYKTIQEKYPFEGVFLIVWTLIVLTLTILQRRFIYLLAVNVAIFSAYFVLTAAKAFASEREKETTKKKRKVQRTSNSAFSKELIVVLLLFILLSAPDIAVIKSMATEDIAAPDADLRESFDWLRENSPPTSYYYTPDKPAEYGVMSWWDYGNWILYLSQRPVVANNFQTGIDDAAHFLITPDEEAANEILSKRKVRFIITDAKMLKLKFQSIAMSAGKNPEDYYGIKQPSDMPPIPSGDNENKKFFDTMLSQLHVFDGSAQLYVFNDSVLLHVFDGGVGLGHYRLIYESKTSAIRVPDIKYVKIFEYVPGATISGKTDGDIEVTANIMTNQGRTFTYTQRAISRNGKYEIKVPYSTRGNVYGTKSQGDYTIRNANVSKIVPVNEQDVQEGRELAVDLI
ncbi:Dolichyl-monophosphooligosaccharide--protein glycotransferase AglB [uncultured archaeon]|nr:Dolichyl-monophosphooligosaccharide--protein glycotransferase AglB [uncultured archaeon]